MNERGQLRQCLVIGEMPVEGLQNGALVGQNGARVRPHVQDVDDLGMVCGWVSPMYHAHKVGRSAHIGLSSRGFSRHYSVSEFRMQRGEPVYSRLPGSVAECRAEVSRSGAYSRSKGTRDPLPARADRELRTNPPQRV